jgi:hypothetical protein
MLIRRLPFYEVFVQKIEHSHEVELVYNSQKIRVYLCQGSRSMKRVVLVALALLGLMTVNASAATILTLSSEAKGAIGPQSASNPCVIAATMCQQPAGMAFTNYVQGGPPPHSLDESSPTYTVGQLEGFVGSLFNVAIDVNTTGAAGETLQLFEVIIGGLVQYNYIGPTVIGGINNNGNGFADWTLRTVDLSSFGDDLSVVFRAVWNNATDGGESFFLVAVPGPIVGAGIPGLILACGALIALARRRRTMALAA